MSDIRKFNINTSEHYLPITDTITADSSNIPTNNAIINYVSEKTDTFVINNGSEFDLAISDNNGNILCEFIDGNFNYKNKNLEVLTCGNNDFLISDSSYNIIAKFTDGHIITKNFNSAEYCASIKKQIKILFIGNSVCQDHASYLPYLLDNLYKDIVDFEIGIFYIGGWTVKKYVTDCINGTKRAEIWSTCKNTSKWTNTSNISLTDAIKSNDWDIISLHGFFDNNQNKIEDLENYLDVLIKFINDTTNKPFELAYFIHQTYLGDDMLSKIITGAKYALTNHPFTTLFSAGLATEFAKNKIPLSTLTPDNVHNIEGLPCIMGAYTLLLTICEHFGLPVKVLGDLHKLDYDTWQSLNIPGQNGTPNFNLTDNDYYICQNSAIKGYNAGKALYDDVRADLYKKLINK